MESFEDLVVGITADEQVPVNKSFMQGFQKGRKPDVVVNVVKNGGKPFNLFFIVADNIIFISVCSKSEQILGQQVEIFVECRLWCCIECDNLCCRDKSSWRRIRSA